MLQLLREIKYMFIRGLKQSMRPVAALIPSLIMPSFFLIVNSAAGHNIPHGMTGFNNVPYFKWYAPVAILQAIFFSSGDAGIDLVVDITSGYFDKLLIAPIHHIAIIIGKLLGVGVRVSVQTSLVVFIYLLMGGHIAAGVLGFVLIILLAALFGMAWSGVGMTIALRTKNQRATQSAFILFFPFTFITTALVPASDLSGWYRFAAVHNPVTNVLEAIRSLVVWGLDAKVLEIGFLTAFCVAVLTITAVMLSFKKVIA